jgi:hypothetical protein
MRIDLSTWEGTLVCVAIAEALRASPHLFDDETQREALWAVEERISEALEDAPPLTQEQYDRIVAQNKRFIAKAKMRPAEGLTDPPPPT